MWRVSFAARQLLDLSVDHCGLLIGHFGSCFANVGKRRSTPCVLVRSFRDGGWVKEAVLGNVGGERCLEFTVIGDTVNVASRLERLTRDRGSAVAASGEAIAALREAGGRTDALPLPLNLDGPVALRGRAAAVEVWGAYWPGEASPIRTTCGPPPGSVERE